MCIQRLSKKDTKQRSTACPTDAIIYEYEDHCLFVYVLPLVIQSHDVIPKDYSKWYKTNLFFVQNIYMVLQSIVNIKYFFIYIYFYSPTTEAPLAAKAKAYSLPSPEKKHLIHENKTAMELSQSLVLPFHTLSSHSYFAPSSGVACQK